MVVLPKNLIIKDSINRQQLSTFSILILLLNPLKFDFFVVI